MEADSSSTDETAKSERVRYTNLLILERWNELEMPLVDYLDPGRSLLIQYGPPRRMKPDSRIPTSRGGPRSSARAIRGSCATPSAG